MPRCRRSAEELQGALVRITYEIEMMKFAESKLMTQWSAQCGGLRNALLESFLLHVRNLLEFLHPTNNAIGRDDTVISRDFFPSPDSWQGDIKDGEEETRRVFEEELTRQSGWEECNIDSFRLKLHRKLAHATYSREAPPEWPYRAISQGVERGMAHFRKKLSAEGLGGLLSEQATEGQT